MTTTHTRPSPAIDAMWANSKRLGALLPPGMDVNLFIASAASALYNNPALLKAAENDLGALMTALTEAARYGHLPGTEEYYFGIRSNKVSGTEGYQGLVKRMYNSGQVAKIVVREVCANDTFTYIEGRDDVPYHHFGASDGRTGADFFGPQGSVDRGEMVGVYAVVQFMSGHWSRPSILSREDVHAARASGGWKATDPHNPWNRQDGGPGHPEFTGRSMWWKTALKRQKPWVTLSAVDKRQAALVAGASAQAIAAPYSAAQLPKTAAPAIGNGHQAIAAAPKAATAEEREAMGQQMDPEFDRLGIVETEEREAIICRITGCATVTEATVPHLLTALERLERADTTADLQ